MKINTDAVAKPITKPVKPAENKEVPVQPAEPSNTQKTSGNIQHQIQSWFAKAGITANMAMSDAKGRHQAIERRRQIQASNKINNLQSILSMAMSVSVQDSATDNLDPDWFFTFIEMAENVYSPTMQELWGKIFAVEVSRPGSFSIRTLETLKVLTQKDAKLFTKAASLASRRQTDAIPKILVGYHQRKGFFSLLRPVGFTQLNLSKYGLSYPDLLALIDMKLIYASEIESAELDPSKRSLWKCGSATFNLAPRRQGIALVYYKFTSVGAELFRLSSKSTPSDYIEGLKQILSPAFQVD